MSLIVVGISHKTAPVELREKIFFNLKDLELLLPQAKTKSPINELVALSTCNRTELYCSENRSTLAATLDEQNVLSAQRWCAHFLNLRFGRDDLEKYLYVKTGQEAVAHLFNVAAGMDSLVLGENEILKQVKEAYQLAQKIGLTGKLMNVFFQRALFVGKLVRTHTFIAQGALSTGNVAVSLAEKIFGDLSESAVLILGAGKMAEISGRYLANKKVRELFVANRTFANAESLAQKLNARPLTLEEGFKKMTVADIVITSLSVDKPALTYEQMQIIMQDRRNRSLFIIDIGVPRNVEESAHRLDNVYLYNIDDLGAIVTENLNSRKLELDKAQQMVWSKTQEFVQWYEALAQGREFSFKHGRQKEDGVTFQEESNA